MDLHAKRRIFINKGDERFQIFSFRQEKDGSIYASSPTFADAKWISFQHSPQGPILVTTEAIGTGKLSIHGTGMAGVRNNNDPHEHKLVIEGNQLLNIDQNEVGARHLFTVFMDEPSYLPSDSPVFNRQSDYSMQANEDLKPFVLVFFAVPLQAGSIDFRFSLHEDEMINIPNDILGMHTFALKYHNVIWFAYRTKNMDKWPKYAHFSYQDGNSVPLFIGTGPQAFRLEFRMPKYEINGVTITIDCSLQD